jgi:hypothetical protein
VDAKYGTQQGRSTGWGPRNEEAAAEDSQQEAAEEPRAEAT